MPSPAQLNLRGLPPLLRAELQWGLFAHTQQTRATRWDLCHVQKLVNSCRSAGTMTLAEWVTDGADRCVRRIAGEITGELWRLYRNPDEARETGILDTEHFGIRFPRRTSRFDLTAIPQRWLRDLIWDHLAGLLQSPCRPRTANTFDNLRRACVELGAYLAVDAPGGGHDPATLRGEQMRRFVADQRRREREGLPSLGIRKAGGKPSMVSATTRGIYSTASARCCATPSTVVPSTTWGWRGSSSRRFPPGKGCRSGHAGRSRTRSPALWPMRRTCAGWPSITTVPITACATSGRH
jgi:hypothetical protein